MSYFGVLYTVGASGRLEKLGTEEYDGDARGILWMWEPPEKSFTYCMGIDPTVGRTGWNRFARSKEDLKTDNAAIEVVKIGKNGNPDTQVAEFAAPVDATEIGEIANVLGRMYAGTEEDQCKCILEIFPGPGGMTMQRMLELGYTNQFRWEYYADSPASPTKSIGWHASPRTNRDLWVKASRHINLKQVRVRSPFLAEEYADCRMNLEKQYGENPTGHDDRVRAFNLALWVANSWSMDVERTQETVRKDVPMVDPQLTDMTMNEIQEMYAESWGKLW